MMDTTSKISQNAFPRISSSSRGPSQGAEGVNRRLVGRSLPVDLVALGEPTSGCLSNKRGGGMMHKDRPLRRPRHPRGPTPRTKGHRTPAPSSTVLTSGQAPKLIPDSVDAHPRLPIVKESDTVAKCYIRGFFYILVKPKENIQRKFNPNFDLVLYFLIYCLCLSRALLFSL